MKMFFPRVRTNDPETSHAAAAHAVNLAEHHHFIIICALNKPGTIYDIAERTGLDASQVFRRMSELESLNLARTEGKAKGPTGRMCRIWWAIKRGQQEMFGEV